MQSRRERVETYIGNQGHNVLAHPDEDVEPMDSRFGQQFENARTQVLEVELRETENGINSPPDYSVAADPRNSRV